MGWLESLRRIIDGEVTHRAGGEPALTAPGQSTQQFLVYLAREAVGKMQAEGFRLPGMDLGFVPKSYIIFLSPVDAKAWRGEKRLAMLSWLQRTLTQESHKFAGGQISKDAIAIDLRVDATLNASEIRVQAFWESLGDENGKRASIDAPGPAAEVETSNVRQMVLKGGTP